MENKWPDKDIKSSDANERPFIFELATKKEEPKQHHGCLTAYLIFMIFANSVGFIRYSVPLLEYLFLLDDIQSINPRLRRVLKLLPQVEDTTSDEDEGHE